MPRRGTASAVPLRGVEKWASAPEGPRASSEHRSPSVAKATIMTAAYGTAQTPQLAQNRRELGAPVSRAPSKRKSANCWIRFAIGGCERKTSAPSEKEQAEALQKAMENPAARPIGNLLTSLTVTVAAAGRSAGSSPASPFRRKQPHPGRRLGFVMLHQPCRMHPRSSASCW